jgi:hypothetical protein
VRLKFEHRRCEFPGPARRLSVCPCASCGWLPCLSLRLNQVGLQVEVLEAFGQRELIEVIDLSEFVAEQRSRLSSGNVSALVTPRERVYLPADPALVARLGLSVGGFAEPSAAPTGDGR